MCIIYMCAYVCVCVCVCKYMCLSVNLSVNVCVYVCVYVCVVYLRDDFGLFGKILSSFLSKLGNLKQKISQLQEEIIMCWYCFWWTTTMIADCCGVTLWIVHMRLFFWQWKNMLSQIWDHEICHRWILHTLQKWEHISCTAIEKISCITYVDSDDTSSVIVCGQVKIWVWDCLLNFLTYRFVKRLNH